MSEDQLMSVKDLADYLSVNISTVYQWSQHGQVPAMKIGKMWRYRRADIEEWLNQRRSPAVEREVVSQRKK
jgi:PTS system nitrogen regulatory IIA component